jgi:multidrug resistance efflux pump
MARRKLTIEEKISRQETEVAKAKKKYDSAVEELNRLVTLKKEQESKELFTAIEKSGKSFEEVMEFLKEK